MKAGPYTITQAEAIRRTKQLLASCEPKTNSQQFAHKIFEALLLAHKAGEKSPGALLAACFATDRGEDIGEPPDGYGGLGWMYPEAMIANLELSCKDIGRKAKETVSLLERLAHKTYESARVFKELNGRCKRLEPYMRPSDDHDNDVPSFAAHIIIEMRRYPEECWETINKIAAQPSKEARKRQAVTQRDAAKLCGVTEETIRRWGKGEATPEGYPGRQDAVTLRAWAAWRKEAAKLKRGLTKMTSVRDMDRATQKKQHSDWQADMRRRGATGYRSSDY